MVDGVEKLIAIAESNANLAVRDALISFAGQVWLEAELESGAQEAQQNEGAAQ